MTTNGSKEIPDYWRNAPGIWQRHFAAERKDLKEILKERAYDSVEDKHFDCIRTDEAKGLLNILVSDAAEAIDSFCKDDIVKAIFWIEAL